MTKGHGQGVPKRKNYRPQVSVCMGWCLCVLSGWRERQTSEKTVIYDMDKILYPTIEMDSMHFPRDIPYLSGYKTGFLSL